MAKGAIITCECCGHTQEVNPAALLASLPREWTAAQQEQRAAASRKAAEARTRAAQERKRLKEGA